MVESASKTRDEIQAELNKYADDQIAKWESMTLYSDDKEKNYVIKQDWVDGVPLTVVKWNCKGLEEKHVESWYNDVPQMFKLNPKNTYTRLEDDNGHMMVHVKVGTPMMVSNRAFVQTWYNQKCEDGSVIILSSSQYNEKILEEHKDKTGNSVIANMIIQYTKITPCEGGYELVMCS